jgi:hypothetical protein
MYVCCPSHQQGDQIRLIFFHLGDCALWTLFVGNYESNTMFRLLFKWKLLCYTLEKMCWAQYYVPFSQKHLVTLIINQVLLISHALHRISNNIFDSKVTCKGCSQTYDHEQFRHVLLKYVKRLMNTSQVCFLRLLSTLRLPYIHTYIGIQNNS